MLPTSLVDASSSRLVRAVSSFVKVQLSRWRAESCNGKGAQYGLSFKCRRMYRIPLRIEYFNIDSWPCHLPIPGFFTELRAEKWLVCSVITMKIEKPLEELYNVRVERQVPKERLAELNVSRWSVWKTGKCHLPLPWDWHVDQLVYVEEGEVRVVPEGSERYMRFLAGDLIRYPKWFEADLWFNGPYQERYCFKAYGDD
ncbi:unnamed protein product [Rhodiola kirilowii]